MNIFRYCGFAGVFLTTLLVGCATTSPAERSAQMQRRADEMLQIYGPACDKLGYAHESNEWRNCVMDLANQEEMKAYIRMYGYPAYPAGGPYFSNRRYFYPW